MPKVVASFICCHHHHMRYQAPQMPLLCWPCNIFDFVVLPHLLLPKLPICPLAASNICRLHIIVSLTSVSVRVCECFCAAADCHTFGAPLNKFSLLVWLLLLLRLVAHSLAGQFSVPLPQLQSVLLQLISILQHVLAVLDFIPAVIVVFVLLLSLPPPLTSINMLLPLIWGTCLWLVPAYRFSCAIASPTATFHALATPSCIGD